METVEPGNRCFSSEKAPHEHENSSSHTGYIRGKLGYLKWDLNLQPGSVLLYRLNHWSSTTGWGYYTSVECYTEWVWEFNILYQCWESVTLSEHEKLLLYQCWESITLRSQHNREMLSLWVDQVLRYNNMVSWMRRLRTVCRYKEYKPNSVSCATSKLRCASLGYPWSGARAGYVWSPWESWSPPWYWGSSCTDWRG